MNFIQKSFIQKSSEEKKTKKITVYINAISRKKLNIVNFFVNLVFEFLNPYC